jgi:hypothetical protein
MASNDHHHYHQPPHNNAAHHFHPHAHDHASIAEANRHYFDSGAQSYEDNWQAVEVSRWIGAVMLKAHPFNEETTTLMDYACGTGKYFTLRSTHS